MKLLAGILILASMPYLSVSFSSSVDFSPSQSHKIVCPCNLVYEPVCGSDGRTYSNECVLKCVSKEHVNNGKPGVTVYQEGTCPPKNCFCPSLNQPICGSNNQTYTNECFLRCENNWRAQNHLPLIGISYKKSCKKPSCICPDSIVPVCGSDSKTYRNLCVMQCYSRIGQSQGKPTLRVNYTGACVAESCVCPLIVKELCGNDNNTYTNECVFNCENRRRNQLGQALLVIDYKGKCVSCVCTADYNPVCANDGLTYTNYCQFLCENEKRRAMGLPELLMRWRGECTCGCSKEWRPICASDNHMYTNSCLLRCENRKRYQDGRPQLTIVGPGQCNNCNCSYCSSQREPVCASDGRTYWNYCYVNCNNECRSAVGLPRLWIVHNGEC